MAKPLARVFSGIQPTGIPHLGNYFGAIAQWIKLANGRDIDPTHFDIGCANDEPQDSCHRSNPAPEAPIRCDTPVFSIVDVHAYTSPKVEFGTSLYGNILSTTASLLALGLDTNKCILFRHSDLLEHNYLDNVFHNFTTTQRLSRMTQYKEKTAGTKASAGVLNGLLTYPVLQAADILLYKANLVPVGEDQTQHIELTRDIARSFNSATASDTFPEPRWLLHKSAHARRVKSLREPNKKMSKSDPSKKSFIEVVDEPNSLREKIKKSLTDLTSEVYYDSVNRPGVSNLMRIHHLTTGESFDQIRQRFSGKSTADYKMELADILIEHFRPAREEYKRIRADPAYIESVLKLGSDKARPVAHNTVTQVKRLLGSNGDSG